MIMSKYYIYTEAIVIHARHIVNIQVIQSVIILYKLYNTIIKINVLYQRTIIIEF